MTLSAGTHLGVYDILAPLGAGGMGEVYRAVDAKLGREVAIKVVRDVVKRDPERLRRLEREARALASLNHPGIGAIYGFEEAGEIPFLVLEYVPGETLHQRITRAPIPIKEALDVALQIADALETAHERGIIHRDLKPENIKITPEGKVKVLDFGLAKAVLEGSSATASDFSQSPTMSLAATRAEAIPGTPAYIAPENARGKPVTRRTDIWSFGVILYEMLCRKRLFSGETVFEVVTELMTKEPDWSALPPSSRTASSMSVRTAGASF